MHFCCCFKVINSSSKVEATLHNSGVAKITQLEGVWLGSGGRAPALGDFCNFSIKITHFYADFGQNSYFKAVTYQLKAFKISLNVLNRINEVQVL